MLLDDYYVSFLNLDHRKDRLAHITHEMAKVGIKENEQGGGCQKSLTVTIPVFKSNGDELRVA
jgi:hypothetical protein